MLTTEEVYRRFPDLKPGQKYKGIFSKMIFVCPDHGPYRQRVVSHSQGYQGCLKCSGSGKKLTTKEAYRRYPDLKSGQRYQNADTKMIFVCPTHGPYRQRFADRKSRGCRECRRKMKYTRRTTKEIYQACPDLKPGQRYKNLKSKMIFLCPVHGPYLQGIPEHLRGHGCPKCGAARSHSHTVRQVAEKPWTFSCGCSGILPSKGKSNKFARHSSKGFTCRVAGTLAKGTVEAQKRGFKFNADVPHSVIREMMEKDCWRCHGALDWSVMSNGTTPHLHHNHESGEILGFTHPNCNPRLLEMNNDELKHELAEVETIAENPQAEFETIAEYEAREAAHD
jgi:hypothetical protein